MNKKTFLIYLRMPVRMPRARQGYGGRSPSDSVPINQAKCGRTNFASNYQLAQYFIALGICINHVKSIEILIKALQIAKFTTKPILLHELG